MQAIGIGDLLGQRYRLEALLGAGGMGEVYRAFDIALERPAAIKILTSSKRPSSTMLKRFHREAMANAKVRHPNIVEIYDVNIHGDHPWIAMEHLSGESLEDRLRRTPLSAGEAAWIAYEILGALQHVHDHEMVHRDLKPGNIFLEELPGDGGMRAKLLDFGLVKLHRAGTARLTDTGVVPGTPLYLAPEQLFEEGIDARTDLYALGVVLYRSLTGSYPFGNVGVRAHIRALFNKEPHIPLRKAAPEVPEALAEVIHKVLSFSREERYPSAKEMRQALIDTGYVKLRLRGTEEPRPKPKPRFDSVGKNPLLASERQIVDRLGGRSVRILLFSPQDAYVRMVRKATNVFQSTVRYHPELELSEIHPVEDGYDLAIFDSSATRLPLGDAIHQLRSHPSSSRTSIIVMTTKDDVSAKRVALTQKIELVLDKPVPPVLLRATLLAALERRLGVDITEPSSALTGVLEPADFGVLLAELLSKPQPIPSVLVSLCVDHFGDGEAPEIKKTRERAFRIIGRYLRDSLVGGDLVGRIGEKSYILLLEGSSMEGADAMVSEVRGILRQVRGVADGGSYPKLSLGAKVIRLEAGLSADSVLDLAAQR